jgi:hypothetical protein
MTSANNSHGRPRNTGSVEHLHGKGAGRIRTAIIFTVFAVIFGFLTITSFIQQSPTIDEPIHLLAGYTYVRWGDFRVNPEHPPFGKIWAALPLMALRIADPRSSSPYWNQILETEPGGPVYPLAHEMFFVRNDATTLFFYAKLQMIVLSMVLAAFIYRWTRELFGFRAGVISLFLYGLDPNILAHSAIVHTDLPFAAMGFIAIYFFWNALGNLTRPNLLWRCSSSALPPSRSILLSPLCQCGSFWHPRRSSVPSRYRLASLGPAWFPAVRERRWLLRAFWPAPR